MRACTTRALTPSATLAPSALTPPYWISMGAMAISALAGVLLLDYGAGITFVGRIVADAPELVRATFRKPPAHLPR